METPVRLRILLLSGPTREYLDPVRFISNASSGRQGFEIAREGLGRGHFVEVVSGPSAVPPPSEAVVYPVESAGEMLDRALERHPYCDVLVAVAAVSDFRPRTRLPHKRRREEGTWLVELEPTEDILAALAPQKESRIHVGFAVSSEDLLGDARAKLHAKNLDLLVANPPETAGAGAGRYILLERASPPCDLGRLEKAELAKVLLDRIEEAFASRRA